MRFRLLLVVLLFMPFALRVQSQSNVTFYSKGKMYVKYRTGAVDGTLASSTTLHVQGSMRYATGAEVEQKGRTEVTGDIINSLNPSVAATAPNLFVNRVGADGGGVIAFTGADLKQSIKGDQAYLATGQKALRTLFFPTIRVEQTGNSVTGTGAAFQASNAANVGFVSVDPFSAITVDNLVVKDGRRFRVESAFDPTNTSKLNTAHVKITAKDVGTAGTANQGFMEVDLNLYRTPGTNVVSGTGSATRYFLTGFTPLYKEMGSDYMFYQVLTRPNGYSMTSYEGPLVNPNYRIKAGVGHFMAMDVLPTTDAIITDVNGRYNTDYANRFQEGYTFSRRLYKDYFSATKNNFNKFSYTSTDANYINETFNDADVTVQLQAGLNFLGNPFLAPISLNAAIINPTNAGLDNNTNSFVSASLGNVTVYRGNSTLDPGPAVLRDKYWVINQASVSNPTASTFNYQVSYDYVSYGAGSSVVSGNQGGGTNKILDPTNYLIAPMQMFCLQASAPMTVTLSTDLIVHGNAQSNKSAATPAQKDWFVLEASADNDKTSDRTVINFRENASLVYNEQTDTRKGLSKKIEDSNDVGTVNNLLYTKSSDGVAMLGNTVPTDITELALYFTPPATTQSVQIRAYGLDQLESVQDVWLVDKFENKKVKLTPETVYEFTSQPVSAKAAADQNRFVLQFKDISGGEIISEDTDISAYYNGSSIVIKNLMDKDKGSDVFVYDLQGRLLGKTLIKDVPQHEYPKVLSQGTYIVKVSGARNYTTKFVNLHN